MHFYNLKDYEWFLVGIKLNNSIVYKKKHRNPSEVVSFTCFPFSCSLSESRSGSTVKHLFPRIPNNTESDFFTAHSPCLQRRKSFGSGYSSVYSGLWPHPIQWEWGNVGVTYKLFEGLGYSRSFLTGNESNSVPPPL